MSLAREMREILDAYLAKRGGGTIDTVEAQDCRRLRAAFRANGVGDIDIRNLRTGDVAALRAFGDGLGPESRHFFAPYPWADDAALDPAFETTIRNAESGMDLSFLLWAEGVPAAHFFLWRAGGNAHSRAHGLEVPELGVAVIDARQGQGLGALAVRLLLAAAADLGADAVELTTAMENEAGWRAYLRTGFEYTGLIKGPLDVDVTAAFAGEVAATRFRDERQMIHILRPERREAVLRYAALRREEGEMLYRRSPGAYMA